MKLRPKYSLKLTRNQTDTHTLAIRNRFSSHRRRHHSSNTTQRPKQRNGTGNDVGQHRSSVVRQKTASEDRKRRLTAEENVRRQEAASDDRRERQTTENGVKTVRKLARRLYDEYTSKHLNVQATKECLN